MLLLSVQLLQAQEATLHDTGDLRLTPVLDQRMLLWAFKVPPSVSVRLAVQGPIGGAAYDVSQFAFIQVRCLAYLRAIPQHPEDAVQHTLDASSRWVRAWGLTLRHVLCRPCCCCCNQTSLMSA